MKIYSTPRSFRHRESAVYNPTSSFVTLKEGRVEIAGNVIRRNYKTLRKAGIGELRAHSMIYMMLSNLALDNAQLEWHYKGGK